MRAVIYRQKAAVSDSPQGSGPEPNRAARHPGVLPVAGVPLLLRQVQWLRSIGIRDIAVGLGQTPEEQCLVSLLKSDVLGRSVRIVPDRGRAGPREVAQAAKLPLPVLAVPADVIGDGDLTTLLEQVEDSWRFFTLEPAVPEQQNLALVSVVAGEDGPNPLQPGPGWGMRVRDYEDARQLSHAVLMNELPARDDEHKWPIIVHAHLERADGIWVARGARVHKRAHLHAPVLVGRDAVIERDAVVGPDVFLEDRAAVAARAQVSACFVTKGTLIGEGVELARVVAYPDRVHDLHDPEREERLTDGRVVAARDAFVSAGTVARLSALFALAVVAAVAVALYMSYSG